MKRSNHTARRATAVASPCLQRRNPIAYCPLPIASFRRAFTLIEVLAAIAVLALLAAIALPAIAESAKERSFRAAMERLEAALGSARLDAIRERQLLLVRAQVVDGKGLTLTAAPLDLTSIDVENVSPAASRRLPQANPTSAPPETAAALTAVIPEAGAPPIRRELIRLPAGLKIVPLDDIVAPETTPRAPPPPRPTDLQPEPIALAVFFPDGSAVASVELVLSDGHGRLARLEIGRLTGRVRLIRDDAALANVEPAQELPAPRDAPREENMAPTTPQPPDQPPSAAAPGPQPDEPQQQADDSDAEVWP